MGAKWAAGILLAMASPATAAVDGSDFDLSGSVRLRYETISGQLRPGFNRDDDLVNLRTTLHAAYAPGPFHVVGELYDSRVYGGNAGTPITISEVDALEVVQAYVGGTIDNALGKGSRLIIDAGRMMLNIGSRRLVAADDYRNTTNSYTGVRAEFSAPAGWKGTLIYVLPQMRLPDDVASLRDNRVEIDRESFDLVLWGGTVSRARAIGPIAAEFSFYHLAEHDSPGRPTRNRTLDTFGGRLFRDPAPGAWDVQVESYGQTGQIRSTTAATAPVLDVRAWFVHAETGYTFAAPWHPRLSIDYDQASGDGPGARFGRFDTLFGMRRADLAPSGLYAAVARANILSPGVRLEAVTSKRTDWFVSYRPMWLDSRTDSFSTSGLRDATGRSGRFAGHQIDARTRYWLIQDALRFEVDGVLVANGHFLKAVPGGTTRDTTAYLSMNLTATF